jgi:hypothetical protein
MSGNQTDGGRKNVCLPVPLELIAEVEARDTTRSMESFDYPVRSRYRVNHICLKCLRLMSE